MAGAFEAITGYTYEEYVARGGWLAALHPDDLEQDARDMETLRQNRDVVTEVRTFTKSGELRWVRVYGHPVWDPARAASSSASTARCRTSPSASRRRPSARR